MSASTTESVTPTFVQDKPYKVDLEPGKEYYWCSCGESKSQPFCDGSHRKIPGNFKPKKITVDEAKTYFLCGCKVTHNEQGFCDGTHRKEEGVKKYNQSLLKSNGALKLENEHILAAQADLRAQLAQAQRKQKIASVVAGLSATLVVVGIAVKYLNIVNKN